MSDMYQGYENYPTFTVALWINNDRSREAQVRMQAVNPHLNAEEHPDVRMAEWLQKMTEESFTDSGVTLAMDNSDTVASTFLNHVMNEVDWLGLARKYISDEKEEGS